MNSPTPDFSSLPSTRKYFNIGEIILSEGDATDGWYVLMSGRVGVFKSDLTVAEISKPGTVIGELGFLLNIPRTATLIAQEPTLLLHITMSLDQLFADHPELAKNMLVMIAERLVKTTEDWREAVRPVEIY
jgi:NTE family protein